MIPETSTSLCVVLTMNREFPRWQKETVKNALKARRVVMLTGSRQCGKTTLAKQIVRKGDIYRTLDEDVMRELAKSDPVGFLKHGAGTMIIDEIQKVPSLLPAIKRIVDENNAFGQFLITGSADIRSLPDVSESLAGRVAHVRLGTLSVGEFMRRSPGFLDRSFRRDWPAQIKEYDKEATLSLAFRGGYPEVFRLPLKERRGWFTDYAESLLARDLRDIANIRRLGTMRDMLYILAAWSSKLMDVSGICGKLAVARGTLENYINALLSLCLFEKVPPWVQTDYDRVGRREKIFATDTGLMAGILNWRLDDVLLDPDRCGKIIETFVFRELSAQIALSSANQLYHYRDRTGREIDFIIENEKGETLGIEVKSGSAVSRGDCRHMVWFRENIVKDRTFTGIVLYTGENTLPLGVDMYALPIATLWQ